MTDAIHMEMGQAEEYGLPVGTPPALVDHALLHGRQPTPQEAQVIMHQGALRQIAAHATSDLGTELGGVLVGTAYMSKGAAFVEVMAAVPAHSDEHGPVHFTFTADAWAQITADREELYPDLQIVGWFHTHPDLGVFYSSDDVVVHSVAFRMPWHVGLVVDPVRQECGLFGWVPVRQLETGELQPLRGYYELISEQAQPVVPWRFTRYATMRDMMQAVWPTTTASADPSTGHIDFDSQVYVATREVVLFPPRINFLIASGAVLLALLVLLAGVLPLRSRNLALAEMVRTAATADLLQATAAGWANCPDPDVQILLPTAGSSLQVGPEATVFGVAEKEAVGTYELAYRPQASGRWMVLAQPNRWGHAFRELGAWRTIGLPAGTYVMRLMPYDANGNPMPLSACMVDFQMVGPLSP